MSLCVRYVSDKAIREEFLDFIPVYNLTGEGLDKKILNYTTRHNLNANYLIGQEYDGASAMSDAKAAATARMMLLAIQQSDFLVSVCVLSDVLSMTHRQSVFRRD